MASAFVKTVESIKTLDEGSSLISDMNEFEIVH